MLSSQLHPTPPSLEWQPAILRSLILLIIIHLLNGVNVAAQLLSIPITSPQIIYTPFTCNASTTLANPQSCSGAWRFSNSSPTETISTTGPSSASGNIIPQMFFEFQASALFLTTLRPSNASVNITISTVGINKFNIFNSSFDSSLGYISVINLPQSQNILLTITYIPTAVPTRFDLQSLLLVVPANTSTNSIFPTPTLPPSMSLPTFIPTTSSSSTVSTPTIVINVNSNKKKIAEAVGITLGLGLGLTTFSAIVFYYWRRRRRHRYNIKVEEAKSEWTGIAR